MNFRPKILVLVVITQCCLVSVGIASYVEQVSLISVEEKTALDKFKAIVIPRIPSSSYVQQYKNDDLYFIRWLRARKLNVVASVEMFMAHLAWREDYKVDTIDQEDWSRFEKDYPLFDDTVDKTGSPALEHYFPYWNTGKAVLAGDGRRLFRWVIRNFEGAQRRLYSARAEEGKKEEVSGAVFLTSVQGFNLTAQACPACIAIYGNGMLFYENNYPGLFKDFVFCDTPPSFKIVMRAMRPLMSPATRKAFRLYSSKAEWTKVLDKEFDKNQRSALFGGTIQRELQ